MARSAPAARGPWLYGPATDLGIGCGLWYVAAFIALIAAGDAIRSGGGMTALPFLTLVFGTPHYGATLLRVYRHRQDRRAYAFFAVYATAVLAAAFVAGVHQAWIGSLIVTVYLTWSPWHYTGQNYGLAVMFLRRRGVDLPPGLKRLVYASFILSYVLTFLAVHSGGQGSHYAPLSYDASAGYRFLRLGLPSPAVDIAFAAGLVAYLGTLGGAAWMLLRRASPTTLLPAAALALTQALWFTIPLVFRHWEIPTGVEPWESAHGAYYFLWIAIGHSVQYVWVTSYFARAEPRWRGHGTYFLQIMLAGAAIWVVPALIFSPSLLGRLPFDAGLSMLVASTVNLHHFVLDGAIWKLRDGRVARILLRTRDPAPAAEGAQERASPWPARLIWGTGALCAAVLFGATWETHFGLYRAFERGELARAQLAAARLAWVGRDSADVRISLGRALRRNGDLAGALGEFGRSLELRPSAAAWTAIGDLHTGREEWELSASAYESALALDPELETVQYGLGLARLRLGQPRRARDAFARAVALNPERKINRVMLERAEQMIREESPAAG